jgi:hypothetical protein
VHAQGKGRERGERSIEKKNLTVHMYYKKNRGLAFLRMRLGLFGMANANE